jgi:hypothetical protein
MRSKFPLFAVFLSCVAGHALAGTTLTLTGAGSYTVLDGIYISPYTATVTVNNVTTLINTPVICDDFMDEVYLGETWNTSVGTVGSTSIGLFGPTLGTPGPENSQGYGEVAWLSEQLLANPSNAGAISYAIWAVFEPNQVSSWLLSAPYNDTKTYDAVFVGNGTTLSLLAQAAAAVPNAAASSNFSNVTVYTPSPSGAPGTPGQAQEFLVVNKVSTPEASAGANLAIDFLAFGALLFVFRRNKFATR